MTKPTCSTCRFYEFKDWSCRRYPPKASKECETFAFFPTARPDDWCGEHKPSTPLVTENNT
jgi:hypothetical protein